MTRDELAATILDTLDREWAGRVVPERPSDLAYLIADAALAAISRHESATKDGERAACSECGVPIAEHPLTDACAIAQERRAATPDDRDREVERIAAMGKALIDLTSAYHHERRHEGRWDACQRPRCQNARLAMQNRGPFADAGLRASGRLLVGEE